MSPLLDELLTLDAGARAGRIADLRSADPALAAEVEELLSSQATMDRHGFLEVGAPGLPAEVGLEGAELGGYTLERLIGQGGMGAVWLAHRSDGRFEGQAAVKLLDFALLSRGGVERLRREGSILARLAHPNIARLLDAGIVKGRPYLVLEYVEGEPIDAWCDARALGVSARIRLFLGVVDAVAHAHDKLVLHRDLKPSNVLVTAQGQPKLLDFGIAKLLAGEALPAPVTELTREAGRAFTPAYAAPEQVQGGDATTATDVYALGVVLYRLLTGVHPTAAEGATPVEHLRAVVEVEPPRMSEAALRIGEAARRRGSTPPQLARALRGDLDTIAARALRKAPAERYATAHALAEDLRRHLAHEPIAARPDSFGYRLGKAVRRHRLAFAAAGAVALALVVGVVGTAWEAVEARRQRTEAILQRDRAQRLTARNEAVADFVETMFAAEAPRGQTAALQQMLDRSVAAVSTSLREEPEFLAEVLRVLGAYYMALENPKKAAPLLERAGELAGPKGDPSLRAQIACSRSLVLLSLGDKDGATRALAPWVDAAGVNGNVAAYCHTARANLAEVDVDGAATLRLAERGLELLHASPYPSRRIEATLLGDKGDALHYLGRERDADVAFAASLEAFRTLGREESEEGVRVLSDWANALGDAGDSARALQLHEQILRIEERQRGEEIPPRPVANVAFALESLARYPEALAAYDRTLTAAQRTGSAPGVAYAWTGRASVLERTGDLPGAESALQRARALVGDSLPEAHPARLRQAGVQARIDLRRGRPTEARAALTRVIELLAARGLSHPAVVNAYCGRAEAFLAEGDRVDALADATKALDLARGVQGGRSFSVHTGRAWLTLGKALRRDGQEDRAREAFGQARAHLAAILGAGSAEATEAGHHLEGG